MRFIHVSVVHVIPRGKMLDGVGPVQNLEKCVADINQFARAGSDAPAFALVDVSDYFTPMNLHHFLRQRPRRLAGGSWTSSLGLM